MKTRCLNPKCKRYKDYGGRGITVCEEWVKSFKAFARDMGERPPGMTIERKDTSRGYEKDNCEWADYFTQNNNRRDNKIITYNGKSLTLNQWAKELGLNPGMVSVRIRSGMPIERVLTAGLFHNGGYRRHTEHIEK